MSILVELGPLTVCRFELLGTLELRDGQKQYLRIASLIYDAHASPVTDADMIWQTLVNLQGAQSEIVHHQRLPGTKYYYITYQVGHYGNAFISLKVVLMD